MKLEIKNGILTKCTLEHDYEDVIIPDYVKIIQEDTFNNLKINRLIFPESRLWINSRMMKNCDINYLEFDSETYETRNRISWMILNCNIKNIKLTNKITPEKFVYGSTIENMEFGDNVRIIARGFAQNNSIENLKLNEGLAAIECCGFSSDAINSGVTFPSTLRALADRALQACIVPNIKFKNNNLNYIGDIDSPFTCLRDAITCRYFDIKKLEDNINIIPVDNIIIDDIYYKYFKGVPTIPEGITQIFNMAFSCAEIDKIILPSTVENIKPAAFLKSSLTEIKLNDKLKNIETMAFGECTKLRKVDLKNVENIYDEAFACGILNEIKMSPKIKRIGIDTFRMQYNLSKINFPPIPEIYLGNGFVEKTTDVYINEDTIIHLNDPYKYKIHIRKLSLDELIEDGRAISEINQIYKMRNNEGNELC